MTLPASRLVPLSYLAITLVMTWPIAAGIGRDIPVDLGDPVFVAGIMAWGAEHWVSLFTGDASAAVRFWSAPIFYPEPETTAYSEHFALHSLLTLPLYVTTRNAVLCYNVWFLATFVIGAYGMYLLVRDLTGRPGAAYVAGLAFAFAPYRVAAMPHLQVLSSQWMPFVLLGLRRYFRSGNSDALLGAGAALWAQNLSSGYYLVFFSPFVAVFALVEMTSRGLIRNWRTWRDILVTGLVSLAATMPFVAPYLGRGRASRRPLFEVDMYSADLLSWVTASPLLHVWGRLQTLVKAEGFLFPGVTVLGLALWGLIDTLRTRRANRPDRQGARVVAVFGGIAVVLSFWLSLGPLVEIRTEGTSFPALYRWAWEYLPGFNAARVPARFATITVLALALLAGLGLAAWDAGRRRWLVWACGALVLAEGAAFPLPTNGTWTSAPGEVNEPAALIHRLDDAPRVFRYLRTLEPGAVIAHFPFGLPEREIQYGYYASLHGVRIVNGYSGSFPPSYGMRLPALGHPLADPQTTLAVLESDRVTHAVVHTAAWREPADAMRVVEMLERGGWQRIAVFDRDYVLAKRRP